MVLSQVGVLIAGLLSNVIIAKFWIWVFVGRPCFGRTLKKTCPLPPGGKKPSNGSVGGSPVAGSMEVKVQVARPVLWSRAADKFTSRLVVGLRSMVVAKLV